MSNQDHEATAKRILPCNCSHKLSEPHGGWCLSYYRPAVAAALAQTWREGEQEGHDAGHAIRDDLRAEVERLTRERDDWKIAHAIEDEMGSRLVEQRDAAEAKGIIAFIRQEESIRESWRSYQGGLNFGEFAVEQIAKAGKP